MIAKKTTSLKSIVVLAALGWIDALISLVHQQKLLAGGLDTRSFCNFGAAANCDATALSSYGFFMGISTSAWALAFYGFLAVFAIGAHFATEDHKAQEHPRNALVAYMCWIALVPTAFLAAVATFQLKTFCLLCFGLYLVNLGLALVALNLRPLKTSFANALSAFPGSSWITALVVAVVGLSASPVVMAYLGAPARENADVIGAYVARHFNQSPKTISTDGAPAEGPASAPITIVEFSDFQCPHCKHAAATLPAFVAPYKDKIRIVFKNYPLSSSCNPAISSGGHALACPAAKTGWCVFKSRGDTAFFAYTEAVFAEQESLSNDIIREAALKQGLDAQALDACLQDPSTHQAIVDQTREGQGLGIEGTPAIYINGRFVETGASPQVLKPLLERYAAEAKAAPAKASE